MRSSLNLRRICALLPFMLLFACSDDPGGSGDDQDVTDIGTGDAQGDDALDDVGVDDANDDSSGEDVDAGISDGSGFDDAGPRLGPGELCTEDAECDSDLCFRFDPTIEEGFCTTFCSGDGECPLEDYDCVFLSNSGGDIARVCVPDSLCIDRDEDGWGAGPGCLGNDCDDSRANVNGGQDELCDGFDNDCDGNIDENPIDANQDCDTGFLGRCSTGRVFCQSGLAECVSDFAPTTEVCDGVDNDCDGLIDEGDDGEPLRVACYSGPADTQNIGACRGGFRSCIDGGLGLCEGETLPLSETCDGADNDCDGDIDEDEPGANQPCEVPDALGVCARGRTQCTPDGGGLVCVAQEEAGDETCDGVDNDCDGSIDEGEDDEPLTRVCFGGDAINRGVGQCTDGIQTCVDSEFGDCIGDTLPLPEVCDGNDNDCDGDTDEGDAAGGFVCTTSLLGACATGTTICTEDGTVCEPINDPIPEVCDGIDNDCDGLVDEGDVEGEVLQRRCYDGPEGTEGVGQCVAGIQFCGAGEWGTCSGQIEPEDEECNMRDDDCDGETDEGNPEAGFACSTGLPGVCGNGVTSCREGALICLGSEEPGEQVETCDGFDNDCDGSIDEDDEGRPLTRACYDGPDGTVGVGRCTEGVETCSGGDYGSCVGQRLPGIEQCNGEDDNCDGERDEGNPGGNVACTTGEPGVCSAGLTICTEGGFECVQSNEASDEICDGVDNDCDGGVDEGEDGGVLRRDCYSADPDTIGVGRCRGGQQLCGAGGFGVCLDEVTPTAEVCNGEDDNCNGVRDEGNPGGGLACTTELPGACSVGVTACVDGGVACQGTVMPGDQVEVCDGIDNDCDGLVDENEDGEALTRSCYDGPGMTEGVGQCTAGTQTCSGGEFGRCVGQVLPSAFEVCDGEDNDCNGLRDDGNPGGGLDCATDDPGVCAFGETSCVAGALLCVGAITPGDEVEVCDGFDNDCDGGIDELADLVAPLCPEQDGVCAGSTQQCGGTAGWLACGASRYGDDYEPREVSCDGLDNDCDGEEDDNLPAEPCANQSGVCAGSTATCGGELGWLACGAADYGASYEMGNELSCDNLDNDCDGTRDEDFQTGGRFIGDTACGNCFTDCTAIFDRPNGFGECDSTGTPTCVLSCDPGFFNLNDVPADGCEFGLDPLAVYVSESSPESRDDAGCGDGPAATGAGRYPCASIGYALANRTAGKERLLVANGAYEEVVTLVAGIDVLGGYRADTWERDVSGTATAIRAPSGAGDLKTVIADGIRQDTVFEGFLIYGANAVTAGANSYAIYVRDSDEDFELTGNTVFAGAGAAGARGTDGFSGLNGVAGSSGRPTFNTSCSSGATVSVNDGGAGGVRICDNPDGSGTTDVSGGSGGNAVCPQRFRQEGSGTAGANSGGNGGEGGWGHDTPGSCFPTPGEPETGEEGGDGPAGTFRDGAGGLGCFDTTGSIVDGEWRASSGAVGAHGAHGAGGGGGGAGSGQDLEDGTRDIAGSGGGGGSGGCAGARGSAGNGGGGSFGIFVLFDTFSPPNSGRLPSISDNTVNRNLGGNGGDGGNGGAGGDPGAGALGGALDDFDGPSFCVFPGAKGGFGARGGHGGGGGGGCGGASFDIVVWGNGGATASYDTSNSFPIPAGSATAGAGGSGGNSSNPVTGAGDAGASGLFGNVVIVP